MLQTFTSLVHRCSPAFETCSRHHIWAQFLHKISQFKHLLCSLCSTGNKILAHVIRKSICFLFIPNETPEAAHLTWWWCNSLCCLAHLTFAAFNSRCVNVQRSKKINNSVMWNNNNTDQSYPSNRYHIIRQVFFSVVSEPIDFTAQVTFTLIFQ